MLQFLDHRHYSTAIMSSCIFDIFLWPENELNVLEKGCKWRGREWRCWLVVLHLQPCIYPQVNIYVDAVINHMCGAGGGEGTHSSCGSWFSAGKKDFPTVPFTQWDFNDHKCRTGSGNIENYGDSNQVMNVTLHSSLHSRMHTMDRLVRSFHTDPLFDLEVF